MELPKDLADGVSLAEKLKELEEYDSETYKLITEIVDKKCSSLEQIHGEMDKTIEAVYGKIPIENLSKEEKFAIKHLYMLGLFYALKINSFIDKQNYSPQEELEKLVEAGMRAQNKISELVEGDK